MKNIVSYERGRYINKDAPYGTQVTARFYKGNKIIEGESFSPSDFTYIDEMGKEWHKGHLLAKSLGGNNTSSNLLPMTQTINLSEYKEVENSIHKLIGFLPEICEAMHDENAYVQFDVKVTNDRTKYIKVAGHEFPSELSYSISLGHGNNNPIKPNATRLYLNLLKIEISAPLSGTLRIDKK